LTFNTVALPQGKGIKRSGPFPEGKGVGGGSPPVGDEGAGANGRWRGYGYEELIARDKASLDIFWLKDESLADSDNLPPPDMIAQEIVEDLEAALEQFREIAGDLGVTETQP
jgi:type I restriction enzyme M protein